MPSLWCWMELKIRSPVSAELRDSNDHFDPRRIGWRAFVQCEQFAHDRESHAGRQHVVFVAALEAAEEIDAFAFVQAVALFQVEERARGHGNGQQAGPVVRRHDVGGDVAGRHAAIIRQPGLGRRDFRPRTARRGYVLPGCGRIVQHGHGDRAIRGWSTSTTSRTS